MFLFNRKNRDEKDNFSNFFKNVLGFKPKNRELYDLAFRHRSNSKALATGAKVNNERLEYLGDAVLSSIVADYLFHKYPHKEEGFLTEMRSKIVSRVSLNKLSQKLGFQQMIHYAHDSHSNFKSMTGNAFEAFVGALYLDRGYNFTKHILIDRVIRIHIDLEQLENTDTNFKSKLLEWSQKGKHRLVFQMVDGKNNPHEKLYHVMAVIDDKQYAEGVDFSIKGAEQLAAEKTWHMLVEQHRVGNETREKE